MQNTASKKYLIANVFCVTGVNRLDRKLHLKWAENLYLV